jgi:hypothetical protein
MPKKETIVKCNLFGCGYDKQDILCQTCSSSAECAMESYNSKVRVGMGEKPEDNLLKKKEPQKKQAIVEISQPFKINGKLSIEIRFDVKWLKAYLSEDNDNDEGHVF